jgi:hypothetical protein
MCFRSLPYPPLPLASLDGDAIVDFVVAKVSCFLNLKLNQTLGSFVLNLNDQRNPAYSASPTSTVLFLSPNHSNTICQTEHTQ